MPLSEHEQRVLAQMEKALYAEDPRLVSTLQSASPVTVDRRRLVSGVLLALAGLAIVVFGVMSNYIWLGAIGFAVMVFGGFLAASPSTSGRPRSGKGRGGKGGGGRGGGGGSAPSGKGPKGPGAQASRPNSAGFMDRMEQQWDKRREQGPF